MLENILNPIILCFIVGLVSGLLRSNLRVPDQLYESLSLYLLFTIGLKGGVELCKSNISETILPIIATIILGLSTTYLAYIILRKLGRLNNTESASIAAHYGSVSAVTFAVVMSFLMRLEVPFESYSTLLVVVLEIPAIAMGIFIAKNVATKEDGKPAPKRDLGKLLHEVFLGKSIYLMVGGLFVGYFSGPTRIASVTPLFYDLFKGALAIFLLEMGIITSRRFGDLKKVGPFLLVFGVTMPIISACLGAILGYMSGLSVGGATVLSTLAASASYIAAPAAMRMALPKANPTLSLTASLGITFPFNITLGIPLYYWIVSHLYRVLGG